MSFEIPPVRSHVAGHSPFTPSFGTMPPQLVGRASVIRGFAAGMDLPAGNRWRSLLVTGLRGTGKTVMLNAFREIADSRQWASVRTSTAEGLVERLTTSLSGALKELPAAPSHERISVSGVTLPAGLGGMNFQVRDAPAAPRNLKSMLNEILPVLRDRGTGLVIEVDEVHRRFIRELRVLTDTVQEAFADGQPLMFVGAGLPQSINDLVNDEVSTFLRRSTRVELTRLDPNSIKGALRGPIVEAGRNISDDALDAAVTATEGWPYLTQLVGDQAWELAADSDTITRAHILAARSEVQDILGIQIIEPTLSDLSAREREYLYAMSFDDGPSDNRTVAGRMGVTDSNASNIRQRLFTEGLVEAPVRGSAGMSLPGMKEYLSGPGVNKFLAWTQIENIAQRADESGN